MNKILLIAGMILVMYVAGFGVSRMLYAQGVDAGSAMVAAAQDAGTAPVPDTKPSESVPNPVEHPGDFLGSLKEAKSKGWFAAILIGLFGLSKALGTIGKNIKTLAWMNKGRTAMVIAGVGTVLAASVDALFMGGTLVSMGVAALYALIGLFSPVAKTA